MFWVDETIKEILKRKDKKYLVTDYKTPSGKIHVGALRGVIIHDVIFRGLKDLKRKTEYWYGFDDLDPMDSLPANFKKQFLRYMGFPLADVPSPDGDKNKSYALYFAEEFQKIFNSLGAEPKIIWASQLYKKGIYNKSIQIVLDNAEKIRKIYKNISGSIKETNWYPFQVICPKCGKIGTTKVTGWDGKLVDFICESNLVKWAKGCGYKDRISPFDGNGKMPYKVETAAKWYNFGTSVELAGKDHYTKGGTFYVAREIARKIFKINPAYGYGYEWFHMAGRKMSTSKGIGVSAAEVVSLIPSELLRFLMVRTRPQRILDFDPSGDTIPLLYDEYDRCIDEYLSEPYSDKGRAYYYSKISNIPPLKYRLRFSKVVNLIQMYRTNIFDYAQKEKNARLTNNEKKELKVREGYARIWLKKYAPEKYKFSVKEQLPENAKNLTTKQKQFLVGVIKLLKEKRWQGEALHQEIHNLKQQLDLVPRQAFSAIYLPLLGKDSGPQAGWFLAALDRDFIIKRFSEAIK